LTGRSTASASKAETQYVIVTGRFPVMLAQVESLNLVNRLNQFPFQMGFAVFRGISLATILNLKDTVV
jgi:hypothetical protein